jgi:7-cyano-7-deazaguanine reductase
MSGSVDLSPLGKQSNYPQSYDSTLLYQINRQDNRNDLSIYSNNLPFCGYDIWNCYEMSWLSASGKPEVCIARFYIPCDSKYLIESKSFKLYLNSFNNSVFNNNQVVTELLTQDLSNVVEASVIVELISIEQLQNNQFSKLGTCLDSIDITIDSYTYNSDYLLANKSNDSAEAITETIHTNLLKSNCPVTGQPDWGTLIVSYTGEPINHSNLLKYVCSLRNHQEFHETCVERIFVDLCNHFNFIELTVGAQYLRRGGLDINPWRSTSTTNITPIRLPRQ